eukprot:14269346-Alexandrium_andersonii.AAC.1
MRRVLGPPGADPEEPRQEQRALGTPRERLVARRDATVQELRGWAELPRQLVSVPRLGQVHRLEHGLPD